MKTENAGIDYGRGMTNTDHNGIRYGVISQNEVQQAWADESQPFYPCQDCEYSDHGQPPEDTSNCDFCEPASWYIDGDGYQAEIDDYGDIFITKSPYYTISQLCSPCAPGAGYIMNECEHGHKSYCFGHDWFDSGKAPYTVYSVEDDSIINPYEQEV